MATSPDLATKRCPCTSCNSATIGTSTYHLFYSQLAVLRVCAVTTMLCQCACRSFNVTEKCHNSPRVSFRSQPTRRLCLPSPGNATTNASPPPLRAHNCPTAGRGPMEGCCNRLCSTAAKCSGAQTRFAYDKHAWSLTRLLPDCKQYTDRDILTRFCVPSHCQAACTPNLLC